MCQLIRPLVTSQIRLRVTLSGLTLFLYVCLQRLCEECPLINIRQHTAELQITLAERLVFYGHRTVSENPYLLAIGVCLHKFSLIVVKIKEELQGVARLQRIQALGHKGERIPE